jgi:hypothetical protein
MNKAYGTCEIHGEGVEGYWPAKALILCKQCREDNYVSPTMAALPYFRDNPDAVPYWKRPKLTDVRLIKVMQPAGSQPTPCNGVCTSGKHRCTCRCEGRCHGAGRCLGGHD